MGYESRRCSCGRFELNAVNRIEELERQLAWKDAEIGNLKAEIVNLKRLGNIETMLGVGQDLIELTWLGNKLLARIDFVREALQYERPQEKE